MTARNSGAEPSTTLHVAYCTSPTPEDASAPPLHVSVYCSCADQVSLPVVAFDATLIMLPPSYMSLPPSEMELPLVPSVNEYRSLSEAGGQAEAAQLRSVWSGGGRTPMHHTMSAAWPRV
eukprot:1000751-Prymnesium_polylepis.1